MIEIYVNKLVNRSNKITVCSLKTAKNVYLVKKIKTTLLTKITAISNSQLALDTMT